ncbi:hypothetical protein, partial [Enterococcus faecium]|uniref:hypothetical protein n=1 Tax=Enterococcus faecium TaxID=1352 RepID=UPI00293150AE
KIGNRTFDVDVEFAVKASQAMENDATYVPITTTPETTVQSGKSPKSVETNPLFGRSSGTDEKPFLCNVIVTSLGFCATSSALTS